MNELEVEFLELIVPSRLSSIDLVRIAEEGKILMIGPDFKGNFCVNEVVTPFSKGFDDR